MGSGSIVTEIPRPKRQEFSEKRGRPIITNEDSTAIKVGILALFHL
jgi:hypothetical protein